MVALTQSAFAAFMLSMVCSMPVKYSKSVKVHQVSKGSRANGPAAYLKALKKHGGDSHMIATLSQIVSSSVNATSISNDLEYLCPITVGNQTFRMDFDTGSSDLWIMGNQLSSTASTGHTFYNPNSSRTAVLQSGETWSIKYADGSGASGIAYKDTVTVGYTSVAGQDVELATQASGGFLEGAPDGLMGLAFNNLNTIQPTQGSTFISTAISQGLSPVFTANLNKGAPGSYEFGAIDNTAYSGDLAYTPVDNSGGFWSFTPDSYSIGTAGSPTTAQLTGILDTGTTLLVLEPDVAEAYWNQVPGAVNDPNQGGYVFPCSASANLPSFTVNINGYAATVPGSYMNYAQSGPSGTCFGGLQSSSGTGFAIYGDVFIKSQFVVFDVGNTALGFAAKAL